MTGVGTPGAGTSGVGTPGAGTAGAGTAGAGTAGSGRAGAGAGTFTPWPVIRAGTLATAVLAVPAIGIAALVSGWSGGFGALLGLAVVAAFFVISKVVVGAVAARAPHLLLPAAMATYIIKILLLGVLLVTVDSIDGVDPLAMAWSVFVGVFVWMGTELWIATHTRVPFYDPATFRERERPAPESNRP